MSANQQQGPYWSGQNQSGQNPMQGQNQQAQYPQAGQYQQPVQYSPPGPQQWQASAPAPGPGQYGPPAGWNSPPPRRPRTEKKNPGMASRIFLWVGILIGHVPSLVVLPLLFATSQYELSRIYGTVFSLASLVETTLGIIAMLLVVGATWTRKLIGAGIILVVGLYGLFIPSLLTGLFFNLGVGIEAWMAVQSYAWVVHAIVMLSGLFIAWNIVRNRVWWTNLAAVGYAIFAVIVVAAVQWLGTRMGLSSVTSTISTQLLSLGSTFVGLGVLHLLGKIGPKRKPAPGNVSYQPGSFGPAGFSGQPGPYGQPEPYSQAGPYGQPGPYGPPNH